MLDVRVRRLIDPGLDRMAVVLARLGCGADVITVGGFCLGMAACIAIGFQSLDVALLLILLNRLADGLDGAVARLTGGTDRGGYLDIVLDMIFYSGVPFAFAFARPEDRLPAAYLIYSFIGTGGSFLAFAAISAKRGITTDRERKKSFFYSMGLMEGTETVVCFALLCAWPSQFAVIAWTFGSLCWLTTAFRIASGVLLFKDPPPKDLA